MCNFALKTKPLAFSDMTMRRKSDMTMRRKTTLAAATLMLGTLAWTGCSDYDNGFTENELTHIKGFEDAFGKIDSEQDWNLAERNTVEVTVGSTSTVQIFALVNGTYSLVGEYSGVTGTQELGFDVVEGTEKIIVSDGKTAISTTMGGVADFTAATRAANVGTTYDVTVATGGYIEFNKAKAKAYDATLPEINDDSKSYGETNLGKVTQNFKYVSNGKFSYGVIGLLLLWLVVSAFRRMCELFLGNFRWWNFIASIFSGQNSMGLLDIGNVRKHCRSCLDRKSVV